VRSGNAVRPVSSSTSFRVWFCVGVAIVAAAFADPLLEFASNVGVFGACNCTDRSNLDVFPALLLGSLLGVRYLYLRVRRHFVAAVPKDEVLPSDTLASNVLARLLPATFALQLLVLFTMETAEQVVVRGHVLGGTIWLGAPPPISLAVHALFCIAATFIGARVLRTLTKSAVRIAGFILRAIAQNARRLHVSFACFTHPVAFRRLVPVGCRIGERAPPRIAA
jgi:hypothetical protein